MRYILMAVSFCLLVASLAGCDAGDSLTPTGIAQTEQINTPLQEEIVSPPETEEAIATEEPTEELEPTLDPTPPVEPTPTATPIVVVDVDSACVNCHNDTDRLKELAVEPEAVELSSGEG